uniref:Rab3 GTPase-activating protein catalytic subunit n=2 Tax=Schistocephalus solidus TaxID=70667 RepID=A0A0V0JB85_SCHSO
MPRKHKKQSKLITEINFRTEERFEDFTNVTPWERFVSELLLLLLEWDLKPLPSSSVPPAKIALVKTGYVNFQAMRFRLDYFSPSEETCIYDEDSSITNVVQSAFGLREFTLLSPADPGVRRLVGTTRIRLLLSSIEMALAESKCALPMLVQYGCNSFYYGLSLKRPGEMETETEGATGVFCEGSGLLKTQYDMSHFELPFSEMGLAKFRNIFDERLEGPKEVLSISCIQYYRLLKLYFTANHEHNGSPEQTDFAVQHVLSNISVQL